MNRTILFAAACLWTRPAPWLRTLGVAGLCCFALASCHGGAQPQPALRPVEPFDVPRYMGTWYEIAAMPNPYQKGCTGTQATYSLLPGNTVQVRNSCHKDRLDGPLSEVVGNAWQPESAKPAALRVQIMWPFTGDYWVLALDPNYRWAVVGQPKRKYLWILSRTAQLDAQIYDQLVARLPEWGYDPNRLKRTLQAP